MEKSGRRRAEAELWICRRSKIWFTSLNTLVIKTVTMAAVEALKHDMFKSSRKHITAERVKQDVRHVHDARKKERESMTMLKCALMCGGLA